MRAQPGPPRRGRDEGRGDRALRVPERLTRVARLTHTLVAVNLVQTCARVTGVAGTVVQVDLTVGAWRWETRGGQLLPRPQPPSHSPGQAPVVPLRQKQR